MDNKNLGVFTLDGEKYPIKNSVYNFVKSYLYDKEYIEWVQSDQPNIKYGVKSEGMKSIHTVCRRLKEILSDTDIGRKVVKKLNLDSIQ